MFVSTVGGGAIRIGKSGCWMTTRCRNGSTWSICAGAIRTSPSRPSPNILRWRLLARYGGVWADATLYCNRPLSEWLPACQAPGGFFAFRTPEAHLYHSWFLVGEPDNPVVRAMNAEIERFFIQYGGFRNYWELRGVWRLFHAVERRAGRHNQWIWRNHLWRIYLKVAPYF